MIKDVFDEIKSIKSGRRQLRDFGLTIGVVLLLIGFWLLWRGRPPAIWFLGAGVIFLTCGFLIPIILWPLQKIWMTLALLIGFFMSRLILLLLFYLVITPVGFFLRLTGRDLLGLKWERTDSYWLPKKTKPDKTSYEKQF